MHYLAEDIRRNLRARPFRPFTICLNDGRRIPVLDHEFAHVSPSGKRVSVFMPDDEHFILDASSLNGADPWAFATSATENGGRQEPPNNAVIRGMLAARPFIPFTIRMTGGSRFTIAAPEQAAFTPTGGALDVFDKSGLRSILALEHIVAVEAASPDPEPTAVR